MPVDNTDYTQGPLEAAFIPDYDDQPLFDSPLTLLDRSTLELWTECPYRAANIESDKADNTVLLAGQMVHDALSRTVGVYIENGGDMTASMIRDQLELQLNLSRPDLQPEVVSAASRTIYSWSYMLAGIHPSNILAFDGGETYDRGGQLARDYEQFSARATSELDFVYASDSPEVLHVVDYKSGWKQYDYRDVIDAFQFQMHAVLLFDKYPQVKAIDYRVWNTRANERTYSVLFKRDNYEQYEKRIQSAVGVWHKNKDDPKPFPVYEKCQHCPLVLTCPAANAELKEVESDPQEFLRTLAASHARIERMEALAAAYVDKTGKDLSADGVAFGREKPKAERKAAAKLYEVK